MKAEIKVGAAAFHGRYAAGSYVRMSANVTIARETKTLWIDSQGSRWRKGSLAASPERAGWFLVPVEPKDGAS